MSKPLFRVVIDRDLCKSCGLCIKFCPKKLLKSDDKLNSRGVMPAKFEASDGAACTGCGNCAAMCPDAAIEIEAPAKPATAGKPSRE